MHTSEHCWKKNSGEQWARSSNRLITDVTVIRIAKLPTKPRLSHVHVPTSAVTWGRPSNPQDPQLTFFTSNYRVHLIYSQWLVGFWFGIFCEGELWCYNKYIEDEIIKMLGFLVVFAGKAFQQIAGIPIASNCFPLLADIFLYSYEAKFIQFLPLTGKKQLASRLNFT